MKKIKLCYLISSLCNEGPVNVIYNILQYINYDRYEVSIVTLNPEKENTRIDDFKKMPLAIFQLSSDKRINLIKQYFRLKNVLKKIKPNVVHGHCSGPLYLMTHLPYKTVYTVHIYPGIQNIALSGWLKGNIIIRLDNYFTKKCDEVICCSESIAERYLIEKHLKYKAIPNGTSYKIWNYSLEKKVELREKMGLEKDRKYFIFIGRFSREKHPEILIQAFANRPNTGLIMLGEGPLWEELKAKKTDNILMPGFTRNVADFLKAADYYISVSDIEGLANTLLESMSVGLPSVLSNIPSHQEVFKKFNSCTKGLLLTDNKNMKELQTDIDEIQKTDSSVARDAIQKVFVNNYAAEIMTSRYEAVYENLVIK